jgi:hypothetical protein
MHSGNTQKDASTAPTNGPQQAKSERSCKKMLQKNPAKILQKILQKAPFNRPLNFNPRVKRIQRGKVFKSGMELTRQDTMRHLKL